MSRRGRVRPPAAPAAPPPFRDEVAAATVTQIHEWIRDGAISLDDLEQAEAAGKRRKSVADLVDHYRADRSD